jgi:hypothetical protein
LSENSTTNAKQTSKTLPKNAIKELNLLSLTKSITFYNFISNLSLTFPWLDPASLLLLHGQWKIQQLHEQVYQGAVTGLNPLTEPFNFERNFDDNKCNKNINKENNFFCGEKFCQKMEKIQNENNHVDRLPYRLEMTRKYHILLHHLYGFDNNDDDDDGGYYGDDIDHIVQRESNPTNVTKNIPKNKHNSLNPHRHQYTGAQFDPKYHPISNLERLPGYGTWLMRFGRPTHGLIRQLMVESGTTNLNTNFNFDAKKNKIEKNNINIIKKKINIDISSTQNFHIRTYCCCPPPLEKLTNDVTDEVNQAIVGQSYRLATQISNNNNNNNKNFQNSFENNCGNKNINNNIIFQHKHNNASNNLHNTSASNTSNTSPVTTQNSPQICDVNINVTQYSRFICENESEVF